MLINGRILVDQGKTEQGLEILKKASQINPFTKFYFYGLAVAKSGNLEEGKALIKELEALPKTSWNALCLGQMYLAKGDVENAVKAFNIDQKHAFYPWIRVLTFREGIKKDPRFLKLIRE